MNTWEDRMRGRPPVAPLLELLEVCWRMLGPSQRVLECGIYRTAAGLEVRVGYGVDDLLYSMHLPHLEAARVKAVVLRQAVVDKGGFAELPV